MEDSTLNETDRIETDLTDRSFFSPKKRKENAPQPDTIPTIPLLRQREVQRTMIANDRYTEPPELPMVVRRSRRLTILNERQQAQGKEEKARNEIAASVSRVGPIVFRDVTKTVANAANREKTKHSSNAKSQKRLVANGKQKLPLNLF